MLDELRHQLEEEEIAWSALACDPDPPCDPSLFDSKPPPPEAHADDVGEDDVDPSIR